MSRYLLSQDSYVCIADDYAVFLDLKRDQYMALEPEDTRILRTLVKGLPDSDQATETAWKPPTLSSTEIANTLIGEGLLTDDPSRGKPATSTQWEPATAAVIALPGRYPEISFRDLRRFVTAWITTTLMLRILPLKYVIERAKTRKAKERIPASDFDLQQSRRLTLAYLILRPNFFSNANACLRDSLTFIEFLARYGLYPTLYFGVRMNPFAAHAWVQEGATVLNDHVVHVNRFTKILAI